MGTKMDIMIFGQLEDITGTPVVTINRVENTELLLETLCHQYPALEKKKFLIAVDQKVITGKTEIGAQAKIALLPPFSGG